MADLTWIIVTYQSEKLIERCVRAIRGSGDNKIIVIDNASTDGIHAILERLDVELISLEKNLGFAAAVNHAQRTVQTRYVGFINPDCIMTKALHDGFINALDLDPGKCLVPHYVVEDGGVLLGLQPGYSRMKIASDILHGLFPGLKIEKILRNLPGFHSKKWHWPHGCCFVMSNDVFAAVGGLDESFFMYMEDVQLGYCLSQHGVPVVAIPEEIRHLAQEGSSISPSRRRLLLLSARLKFCQKHYKYYSIPFKLLRKFQQI